jgi:hypothetical protein
MIWEEKKGQEKIFLNEELTVIFESIKKTMKEKKEDY